MAAGKFTNTGKIKDEQELVLKTLHYNLQKPTNFLKQSEVKAAYDALVTNIKNGELHKVNDDPLFDIDEAVKQKMRKSLKEKKWYNEMSNEVKAICRQKRDVQDKVETTTKLKENQGSSGKKRNKDPSVSNPQQNQNTGKHITNVPVSFDPKKQAGTITLESSILLLKEVSKMINSELPAGSSDATAEIYQLSTGIKSKIMDIESECLDVSDKVKSMQAGFPVQKEDVFGGIKYISSWKDALVDILTKTSDSKDPKQSKKAIGESTTHAAIHGSSYQQHEKTDNRSSSMSRAKKAAGDEKTGNGCAQPKKSDEEIRTLQKEIEHLKTLLEQEKDKNNTLNKNIKKKQSDCMELENHVDYWKNRVSKIAGAKLTDNNPDITDLSDPNRPTRLAEIFNEIYDNIWTDALEELYKKSKKTEKEAVVHLASILKVCYAYCEKEFEETLMEMQRVLLVKGKNDGGTKLDQEEQKQFKDLIKSTAVRTSKHLDQEKAIQFEKDYKIRTDIETYKGVTKNFTKQCLEVCWLMVVQDPPVVLHWGNSKEGSRIDTDRFRCFTRSGAYLEYVVWPAMLLHKEGPLLHKGIVQPTGVVNTKL